MATTDTFEAFARRQADRLIRIGYLISGDMSDAEDLAQETLMRAHRNWQRVRRAQNEDAYVRRILLNCYLGGRRKATVHQIPLEAAQHLALADATSLEDRDDLRARVYDLPPRQRTALVLRYYFDLDHDEIAAEMGITASAVRSTITRAQESLRHSLLN